MGYPVTVKGDKEIAAVLAAKELHTLEVITDEEFTTILNNVLAATGYSVPEEEETEETTEG